MTSLEAIFKAVRENYMTAFVPPNACADQYVADITRANGVVPFNRRSVDRLPGEQAPIVLILESPHDEEYEDADNPAPASGPTGKNLSKYITRVIAQIPGAAAITYPRPLVLVNAVQFQCSLGGLEGETVPTKHHRTAVFGKMWEVEAVRASFRSRIQLYVGDHRSFSPAFPRGYIVINACTTGIKSTAKRDYNKQLRVMVEAQGVVPALGQPSHYHVRHPCYWLEGVPISTWDYPYKPRARRAGSSR